MPADAIVENAGEGFTPEQIAIEIYPSVSVASIRRILTFAGAGSHAAYTA